MSSKKKKILFRLIVLSVLMCVVLPLSVHAALVIGNEFGFGAYVGYWKSQADTVAPPGYLMDFTQYGGQTSVFTTLSTGEVFFGDFTLRGKLWYPLVAAGSDVYIAPGSEGEIPVILMGSRVVNQSTATLQTMALVGNDVLYYILRPFSVIAKYGVLGFLVLGLIWGLLSDSTPGFSISWGSILSAVLGAVFLFAVYAFVDLASSLFFNSALNALDSYTGLLLTVLWAALWIAFWIIIIRMVGYGTSTLRKTVSTPWFWIVLAVVSYFWYPAALVVLVALAALGSSQWFSNFLESQVSFGRSNS